jgi:hypothetical protein
MNEDAISQEDFLKAFGIVNDEAGQSNDSDAGNQNDGQDSNAATQGNGDEGQQNTGDENNNGTDDQQNQNADGNTGDEGQNQNQANKSAQAFAAMRVELSQKNKMLEGVATVLGLDPKSKDSMSQLQSKLTEALAKKQGIPTETLERLNKLEEMEQQRNIEQTRNNAFMGFQQVKTKFNLTDQQLQEFANELVADGKNPFVTPLDLMTEYKLRNFDKLLEQAKTQGAQAEIERSAKANNNASTPGTNQGAGASGQELDKITTIKQLNDWFNQQQSGK